jgi:transketolase
MSDAEFFFKVSPKRVTSFAEDFKRSREKFRKDEKDRELRRAGKAPAPEVTRERLPCEVIHKQDLNTLLRSGQVITASELAKQKEDTLRLARDLEESVRSEISHRRTKSQTEPDKTLVHFTREPFEE